MTIKMFMAVYFAFINLRWNSDILLLYFIEKYQTKFSMNSKHIRIIFIYFKKSCIICFNNKIS